MTNQTKLSVYIITVAQESKISFQTAIFWKNTALGICHIQYILLILENNLKSTEQLICIQGLFDFSHHSKPTN